MTDNEKILLETLERIRRRIAENINTKGLRASGRTERSMEIEMGEARGRLTGRPYFQSLELGRPGGKVPARFVDIIRQWILDKGLTVRMVPYKRVPSERWQPKYSVEERSLRMMAGAIAESIRQRGTLLYRQGGRKDIYSEVIDDEVKRLEERLVINIIETIKQELN